MASVGCIVMMFKRQIGEQGMWPTLQRLKEIGFDSVEISQVPMDEANTADLERGINELGLDVGALSTNLRKANANSPDTLDTDFDKIVADCQRLNTRFVRIGGMPRTAMTSKEACEAWASEAQTYAERLAEKGITLLYHNHHADLAKLDGERIFDLVRRVAPAMQFEVDIHWVQRGGMAPLDMLKAYSGVCKTIHAKDYRIAAPTLENLEMSDEERGMSAHQYFLHEIVQYAEVGAGNINWADVLPAAVEAGTEYIFVEQDETYGRDPFDSVRESRDYLRSIGW